MKDHEAATETAQRWPQTEETNVSNLAACYLEVVAEQHWNWDQINRLAKVLGLLGKRTDTIVDAAIRALKESAATQTGSTDCVKDLSGESESASAASSIPHSKSQYKRLVTQGAIKESAAPSGGQTICKTDSQESPAGEHLDAAAHTDHPLRHWDRTCPACNPAATNIVQRADLPPQPETVLTTTLNPAESWPTFFRKSDEALRIEGMEIAASIADDYFGNMAKIIRAEIARRKK